MIIETQFLVLTMLGSPIQNTDSIRQLKPLTPTRFLETGYVQILRYRTALGQYQPHLHM